MMTSSQIVYQINRCNANINQLNSEIDRLEREAEECRRLIEKLKKLQNDFRNKQNTRKNKLNQLGFVKDVKTARIYCDGMNDLLNGQSYHMADDGLSDGIRKAEEKLRYLKSQIEREMNSRSSLLGEREYLYNQLSRAQQLERDSSS